MSDPGYFLIFLIVLIMPITLSAMSIAFDTKEILKRWRRQEEENAERKHP